MDGPCKALNNGIADVAGAAVKGWINSPGHERRLWWHVDDIWIRVRGTSVLTVVMNCWEIHQGHRFVYSIHTHIICFTKKTDSQRRHASIMHLGPLQESKRPVQSLRHWCCTCFKWHVLPYTALCSCVRQHSKVIKRWCHLNFGQPLFAHSPRICPSLLWKLSMLSIDEGRGKTFTSVFALRRYV